MTTPLRPAYTSNEAAALLNISRTWLVARAREIPGAHRTAGDRGQWRFDPVRFDRYLEALRAGNSTGRRKRAARATPARPPSDMETWLASLRK